MAIIKYQKSNYLGSANPHMGHKNFGNTPIKLPDKKYQREEIDKIEKELKTVQSNKDLIKSYNLKIQSVISKLYTN